MPSPFADWLIDVTHANPLLLGSFLPGNDPIRPTESFYRIQREAIAKEGTELRPMPDSGRSPEEDERIRRALETRPVLSPVLHQDFEDGTWSSLNGLHMPATAAVIQREIKRSGTRALQVSLTSKDDPARAQLRDPYNAPFGEDTWYGFSIRLPASFETNDSVVLAQWCDQVAPGQQSGKKPPMAIRYSKAGGIQITGDSGTPKKPTRTGLCSIDVVEKDVWLDFKFRIAWQKSGDANVTGFLNGKVIFEREGPLGYSGRDLGPYFMLGLKTDSVDEGKPMTAYFDNYSHGQNDEDVDPGAVHPEGASPQRASAEQMERIAGR
jgi:hypothetical protein